MKNHLTINGRPLWLILSINLLLAGASGLATAADFEMPFGLPMAANTRVVDVAQYFVGDIKEANGSLATRDTARDVINFYEQKIEEAGFEVFSRTDQDGRLGFAAKREDGGFFSLSSSSRSYVDVEAGETELRVMIRQAP